MWFKNLQVYRLSGDAPVQLQPLTDGLHANTIRPIGANEALVQGWAPVRPDGDLVHMVDRQMLLRFDTEAKILPASVVNRAARARAAELEEQQGFAPGRRAMKELKERVADELLPRAFPKLSSTFVWIDPVNGWLVVDGKSDDVVKALLKADSKFPLESLRVQRSPVGVMTAWLESDEAPFNFTIDQDAELAFGGAAIRWVKHSLDPEDLRRHIAAGKQCTRLAMTWNSRVSFVLTDGLAIKSVRALDVIRENDQERFDNDFTLMTGELARMLADLVEALGGLAA